MAEQDDKTPIISPVMTAWLKRMVFKIAAIGLAVIGVCLFAILLSYHPSDPSFNSAADADPAVLKNMLGGFGANLASILINAFGFLVSIALAIIPLIWAFRMWQNRWKGRLLMRLYFLPFVLIFLATSLKASHLFFETGLSFGASGEVVYHLLFDYSVLTTPLLASPVVITGQHILASVLTIVAIAGYIVVATVGRKELQIVPRGAGLIKSLILMVFFRGV